MRKFNKKSFWLLIPIAMLLLSAGSHKFYVTTTVVSYKPEQRVLEVISKLFIDDLETVFKKSDPILRMAPDSDSLAVHRLLETFLIEHLKFSVQDSVLPYRFLGKKYQNDLVVCFLEVPLPKGNSFKVENNSFLKLFDDQKNIIHFKNGSKRKSFMLHKNEASKSISLVE